MGTAIGLSLAAALALTLLSGPWLAFVEQMQAGSIVPLDSAGPDYIAGVFWALLLTVFVAIWGSAVQFQRPLMLVWSAKLVVGLGIMLLYDYTYGVDPDGYYANASMPGFEWTGLEIGRGTTNLQQIAWVHYQWLSTSFNAARLTFSLLGVVSVFLIYRAAVAIAGREDPRLFFVFALTPSILFWSSILGKDPVSLFGICAYVYGVVIWQKQGRASGALWIVVGVAVAMTIRAWLGPILSIPLVVLGAFRTNSMLARVTLVMLAVAGAMFGPEFVSTVTGHDLRSSAGVVATAGDVSQSFLVGGSSREAPEISSFRDLAAFAPLSIFTILYRPQPGEIPNLFGTMAGVENLLLLLLTGRAMWRTRLGDLRDPLVPWALLVLLLWAAVYSVVSFQNLGTASRYKLEITPLFLGLLLYLGRSRQPVSIPSHAASPGATHRASARRLWNQ